LRTSQFLPVRRSIGSNDVVDTPWYPCSRNPPRAVRCSPRVFRGRNLDPPSARRGDGGGDPAVGGSARQSRPIQTILAQGITNSLHSNTFARGIYLCIYTPRAPCESLSKDDHRSAPRCCPSPVHTPPRACRRLPDHRGSRSGTSTSRRRRVHLPRGCSSRLRA
jgi:hypothetical protein